MTVGRFFANSSVVTGLMLGTANTLFAQPDWGYPLVGETPTPTPDELKNILDGGWFGWPIWAWVALVVAIIALLLHLRRRGNSAPPPSPPSEVWDGKSLGDINGFNPPPPSSEKKDEKLKEGSGRPKSDIKAEESSQPPPPPPPAANCPQCTAPLKEGQKFCIFCGWDLAAPVEPTQEEVGEPAPPPPPVSEKNEEDSKGKGAASAATGIVMLALVMFGFVGFANAAPVIDFCTPPLLAWDGQTRDFECVGMSLQGLAGAKVTNIPEVSGTVVRSTATTATLRLIAVRNINASYNSLEFAINGQRIGKPIMLVSPEEAGKFAFLRNAILREAKGVPTTGKTSAGTSTTTTPPVVDIQARRDAAEALRIAKDSLTKSGKSDPALLSRITELEEGLKTRLTEAEIRTIARKEADTATASVRSEVDKAKKELADGLETASKEMRVNADKADASSRAVEGRLGVLETSTTRDRAVLQATACAVVADNGGWLGQGPSNRHKKAIRAASTSAGYPACPKK